MKRGIRSNISGGKYLFGSLWLFALFVTLSFHSAVWSAEDVFVIGLTGDAESFDPHIIAISTTGSYNANIFAMLVGAKPGRKTRISGLLGTRRRNGVDF